jgi:hypothetical protein
MIIPSLSEMIDSQEDKEYNQRSLCETSAGAYNAFLAIGQVIAPPFASFTNDRFGFRTTVDVVTFMCLTFALIYFVFGNGVQAIKKTVSNHREHQ